MIIFYSRFKKIFSNVRGGKTTLLSQKNHIFRQRLFHMLKAKFGYVHSDLQ